MTTGLLERIIGRPLALAGNPLDERYWSTGIGGMSVAGVRVDDQQALKISAVYECLRIWGDVIGSLPLLLYRRRSDGGKERANDLLLYRILHDRPNLWQTSIEWRSLMMNHVLMRGNGYSEQIQDDRGFVDQLIPLHPERITPTLQPDGRIVYKVRKDDGTTRDVPQERMFHLRGAVSRDGIRGMGILEVAQDSLGTARATDQHAGRFFSQDSTPPGVLTFPGELSDEARTNLREEWQLLHSGANAQQIAVLQQGMTFEPIAMSHEESQFLESRHFQVADIARWFGIPLMMLQETEKSTSWGTGMEQFQIAFVIYNVRPWCVRWEQAFLRDVIIDTAHLFAEFLLDGLLRGATKDRFEAYQIATGGNGPWMNRNEVRTAENLNPLPGLDEMLQPLNMGASGGGQRAAGASAQLQLIVKEAAGRLVRKECAALVKAAQKHASNEAAWLAWAESDFYPRHCEEIVRDLHVGESEAGAYCRQHVALMRDNGVRAIETFEIDWIDQLAQLALGGA